MLIKLNRTALQNNKVEERTFGTPYMIALLKELLFVLVQRGTKKVKRTTNIFLNVEKSNKNKSCLRKILKSDGTIAVDPKTIMS